MRAHRVLMCLLVLPLAVGLLGTGCEEDDDKSSEGEGVEEESQPTERLMWSETVTIAAQSLRPGQDMRSPGVGKMVATMQWPEAGQLTAYFKKSGPANFGWVKGDSVLVSTCEPLVQDEACTFYMYNGAAVDLTVKFTIKFHPN